MLTKQFLLLLFILNTSLCFSQAVDSLITLLNQTEIKHQKVDLWNEISNLQRPIGGKEAAENALNLAKEIQYPHGEADANYYLGYYYYLKDNQPLAKKHMLNALVLYDSLELPKDKAETLNALGEIYYFDEEYRTALKYFQEVEDLAILLNDQSLLALSYQNKAYIYIDGLEDKTLGKKYLLKCNTILEKENAALSHLIENYLGLATFFIEIEKTDSALLFIAKGEARLQEMERPALQLYLQHSFSSIKGTCYAKTGELDTAEFFIEQSLPFFIENENWYSVAWAYTDLSIIALKKEDYPATISYAKKSIELDVTNQSLSENIKLIRDAYRHLDQDSFHFYNEKYVAIVTDAKNIKDINDLQETLKAEEISKKEEELIKEKNINKNIIISSLLLSLLYGIGLFFYRKNVKNNRIAANSQKNNQPDLVPQAEEINKLKQKVNTIERSLLSKEIDLERQQSSIDHTTQYLKEIVTKDNPTELKKSIQKLAHQLEHNQNTKNQWELFSQQFEHIHPNFFSNLKKHTPNLSIRELRLCAYSRLDMTNQEVAQILGIATSSVGKARHRLKKKMNLDKAQDLNQFLADL